MGTRSVWWMVAALAGCATEGLEQGSEWDVDPGLSEEEIQALPLEAVPPNPAGTLTLSITPLISGAPFAFEVQDAYPRRNLRIFRGDSEQADGLCAPVIAPDCVDLEPNASQVIERRGGQGGTRLIVGTVPDKVPFGPSSFQAVQVRRQAGGANLSNVVNTTIYDGDADPDSDGLTTREEYLVHGTDFLDGDSDGGGEPDGDEVAAGRDPMDPSDDVIFVPLTFWDDVAPIFASSCAPCHIPNSSSGLSVDDYASVTRQFSTQLNSMPRIDLTGDRENSYLWRKINGTQIAAGGSGLAMPRNRAPLPSGDLDIIGAWIDQGAPEGTPPAP